MQARITKSIVTIPRTHLPILLTILFGMGLLSSPGYGGETERPVPSRTGVSISSGYIYDPNEHRGGMGFVTGWKMMDHDYAAFFSTPENLRFKLEASIGSGFKSPWRGMASVNMLSLCYIDRLRTEKVRPYVEGGIGLMYTKRRWEGQGLHLLHNPVAGAGVKISSDRENESAYHISLRLTHASNGGLHSDNKAMNGIMLSTGISF